MSPVLSITDLLRTVRIVGPARPAYTPGPLRSVPDPIADSSHLSSLPVMAHMERGNSMKGRNLDDDLLQHTMVVTSSWFLPLR
jgi:hypothetical protein